ncbi:MAG: hypothetical protein AAF211_04375 [Myxococcota bacterium]
MSILRQWLIIVLVFAGFGLASPDAHAQALDSCFGVIDFSSELALDQVTEAGRTDLNTGLERLELEIRLDNQEDGTFSRAEASPDEQEVFDGYGGRVFAPATWNTIAPNATADSVLSLLVDLPTANIDAFKSDLSDGTLALVVHAEEVPELADGVVIHEWTEADEDAYVAGDNLEPVGPVYTFRLDYPDGAPQAFVDAANGDKMWIMPETGLNSTVIPVEYHYLRVTNVLVGPSPNGQGDQVDITAEESGEQEDLEEIYENATLCNAPATGFCGDRGGTRSGANNNTNDPEDSDRGSQPIRFNAQAGLSGQFHPLCVRPIFVVRLRRGDSRLELGVQAEVDLAVNFHTALDAEALVEEETEIGLGEFCFPVANLTLGPVTVTLAIELVQELFAKATARAGTDVGWSHRIDFSFAVVCESGQGCQEEVTVSGPPFQFSPPQLAHVADASVEAGARLGVALYVGSAIYPACDETAIGGRAGVEAEVAGKLAVQPFEDPWYDVGLTASAEASLDVQVLGFSIVELEATLVEEEIGIDPTVPPATTAPDPTTNARWVSGEDHRWAVAIEQQNASNAFGTQADVAAAQDGGVVVAADARLVKLDEYGQIEWNTRYSGNSAPREVIALPDGTFLTRLRGPAGWAVHAADGAIVDARNYTFVAEDGNGGGMAANAMTFIDLGNGDYDIVLAGEVSRDGLITSDAGGLVRIGRTGTVKWAKLYNQPGIQELHGVTVARNGDLIAVGRSGSPWVIRVDADTGDLLWTANVPFTRGGVFNAVREAPNGTIYASGTRGAIIFEASAIIARIAPDGSSAKHVIMAHDPAADRALDFEPYPYPPTGIGQSPDDYSTFTPGDDAADLEIDGDGIIVTVRVGNPLRSGWMAHLGSDLAPAWFLVFDGKGRDGFASVEVIDDGYFVGFRSDSTVPDGEPLVGEMFAGVMKVPFGGDMHLHPDFSEVLLSFQSVGMNNSSGNPALIGFGAVIEDAPMDTLNNDPSNSTSLRNTLIPATIQQECAVLLTETGRQVTPMGCPVPPDRSRPVVRILSPLGIDYSIVGEATLEVFVTDDVGVVTQSISLDGAPVTNGSTVDMATLGLGTHQVVAEAEDAVGQLTRDEVTFTVIDDVPPMIDIRSPTSGDVDPQATPTLPVDVVVTDAHGEVATTVILLDGQPLTTEEIDVSALAPGAYELRVDATDDAGNAASASVIFERLPGANDDDDDDPKGPSSCSCASGSSPLSGLLLLGGLGWGLGRRRRRLA